MTKDGNAQADEFELDQVFHGTRKPNARLWDDFERLIDSAMSGRNIVVFAHGQTGTGKSTTMLRGYDIHDPSLWDRTSQKVISERFSIELQCIQDYTGKPENLLSGVELATLHDGDVVELTTAEHAKTAINHVISRRDTGKTAYNKNSSRSHAIIKLQLVSPQGVKMGMVTFVDCAGKEDDKAVPADKYASAHNLARTEKLKKEGGYISRSLDALKTLLQEVVKLNRTGTGRKPVFPESFWKARMASQKYLLTDLVITSLRPGSNGMFPSLLIIGHIHAEPTTPKENLSTLKFLQDLRAQGDKPKPKPKVQSHADISEETETLYAKLKASEMHNEELQQENDRLRTSHEEAEAKRDRDD